MNRVHRSQRLAFVLTLGATCDLFARAALGQNAPPEIARRLPIQFGVPVVEVTANGAGTMAADSFHIGFRLRAEARPEVASIDDQAVMLIADLRRRLAAHGVEIEADPREPQGMPRIMQESRRTADGRLIDVRSVSLDLMPVPMNQLEAALREVFVTGGFVPMSLSLYADAGPHRSELKGLATRDAVLNAQQEAESLARGAQRPLGDLVFLRADAFRAGPGVGWTDLSARRRLGVVPAGLEDAMDRPLGRAPRSWNADAPSIDWEDPSLWPAVEAERLAREVVTEIRDSHEHLQGSVEITAAFELLPSPE